MRRPPVTGAFALMCWREGFLLSTRYCLLSALELGDALGREVCEVVAAKDGVEDFEAGDEAWAGAREVRSAVDGVNAAIAHGGKHRPRGWEREGTELGDGFGEMVAAGHDDDDVRSGCEDFVPGDAAGFFSGCGEQRDAAGEGDHLRDPVASLERWVEPLEAEDAGRLWLKRYGRLR